MKRVLYRFKSNFKNGKDNNKNITIVNDEHIGDMRDTKNRDIMFLNDEKFNNEIFRNSLDIPVDNICLARDSGSGPQPEVSKDNNKRNLYMIRHKSLPLSYFQKTRDTVLKFRLQLAFYLRLSLFEITLLSLDYTVLENFEVISEFLFFKDINDSYEFLSDNARKNDDAKSVDVYFGTSHKIRYDIKRTISDLKKTINAITKVSIPKICLYYKDEELLNNNITLEMLEIDANSFIVYRQYLRGGGGVSIIFNNILNYLEIWGYDDLVYKLQEKYFLKPDEYMLYDQDTPIHSENWKNNLSVRLKVTSSLVNITVLNLCFEKGREFVDFIWKDLKILKDYEKGKDLSHNAELKTMVHDLIMFNQKLLGVIQLNQFSVEKHRNYNCCTVM